MGPVPPLVCPVLCRRYCEHETLLISTEIILLENFGNKAANQINKFC